MGLLKPSFRMALQCLMQANKAAAEAQAKELIVMKSQNLHKKAKADMTLNQKCMLAVENLKLQLEILKLDYEERQEQQKLFLAQQEAQFLAQQKQMMLNNLSVHAQEWHPQFQAYGGNFYAASM